VLGDFNVFESLAQFWNPENSPTSQSASFSPSRAAASIINSDLVRDIQGFRIGKVWHRVISLKALPEVTYPGLGARLEELPIGTTLHMSVEVPDQKKEISSLQTQRRVAYSLVAGKRSGVSDLESQAKFHDLEQLLDQMLTEGEKVLRLSLQIVVRDIDRHALDDKAAEALSLVREIAGAEAMIEDIASLDVFSALSLPNARCKERQHRIKSSNVADLLPLVGTWQGHGPNRESVSLRNRRGCLVNVNPFDAGLTNANMLISGGSGAGKSYLTSVLMMQLLAKSQTPPKVIFVDVGGSYDRLCRLMGGYSVEFSLTNDAPRINPFELPDDQTRPDAPKVRFLIGLVELMTKEPGEIGLPRLEKTVLEQCILALYQATDTPTLGDLCQAMKQHPHSGVNSRGLVLESWCGDSAYGALLDGPSSVDLSGSPIAFDLKGLDGHPELQAVMLQIITDLIWRQVQANRSEKKIVVFDECWKLLKDASGQILIEESFRTFRKYQASAIAISQDIADFASSPIAAALISNCSLKWLLKQGQVDEERLAKVLNLNPNELALVRSLEQKRGYFAEAFLMAGEHHSVVSIESTPLEHWLATTHAPDLTLIEQEKQRNEGMSELELIARLSRDHPRGAVNHVTTREASS
jgi:conjugal transfer ATP-binding protein TraC